MDLKTIAIILVLFCLMKKFMKDNFFYFLFLFFRPTYHNFFEFEMLNIESNRIALMLKKSLASPLRSGTFLVRNFLVCKFE